MDKLIFKRPKKRTSGKHGTVVRIGGDAYEIVADISAETGKSVSYIASRMIEFAAEHTRVEDEEN